MRVLSTFSGIEGFGLGLGRAGMEIVAHSEINPFCNRVLARRYPHVPNLGDISALGADELARLGPVDVVVGGFPCQDLSVAGRRAGLAGGRSGLFFEFLRVADAIAPRWLVIENVPGLLSSVSDVPEVAADGGSADADGDDVVDGHNGEDFAVLLGELTGFRPAVPDGGWRTGGICRGPRRTAAWRVFDSQYFGVAQRRRRVFVVVGPGDAGARALLADAEGGRGDPPARRAAREGVAGTIGGGAPGARGPRNDLDTSGAYVTDADVSHALTARKNLAHREDAETYVAGPIGGGDYGAGRDGKNDYPNLAGPHVADEPAIDASAFAWQQGSDAKDGRRGRSWVGRAGPYAGALSTTRHDAVAITPRDVARPLTSSMRKHHDEDTDTLIAGTITSGGRETGPHGALDGKNLVAGSTAEGAAAGHLAVTPIDLRQTVRGELDTNDRADGGAPGTGVGDPGDPAYSVTGRGQAVAVTGASPIQDGGNARDKGQGGLGVGADGEPMYTLDVGSEHAVAYSMRSDAARDGEAKTPSADAEGRVRLRDPGMGVYEEIAPTLDAGAPHSVAHTLRAEGFDASEDGTGRGTPIVVEPTVIRTTGDYADPSLQVEEGGKPMLAANPMSDREMAVFTPEQQVFRKAKRAASDTDDESWVEGEVANTLNQFDGGDTRATELAVASSVRRLTPTECERLQGFPDGWTCLEVDDDGAGVFRFADGRHYDINDCRCADGPRYAACGNAVTVDVLAEIGSRIVVIDAEIASAA